MDPDIPVLSVEPSEQRTRQSATKFTTFRDVSDSPLRSSSPSRTPYKTPRSHPATPVPIKLTPSPSISKDGHRSTPDLHSRRSSSSLSITRGQTPSRIQLRRVSSNLNPASPTIATKPADEMPVPSPSSTAESVAKNYFQRELQTHTEGSSKTAVIVHDSCYGHRFARPRTSKAALSTIVERPERIHATLLGAATAYVRLGDRHADGAFGPHPARDVKTLPEPPFFFRKTARSIPLNHPAVTHIHGAKWMEELQIMCDSAESKLSMNGKELSRPIGYGKNEDGNNLPKLHEGDLYLCSESLAALQGCLGGVCDAVDMVFSSSVTTKAFVCIRPPGHHCSANYPSGFCWLNNVHVGISYAAINHGLTHAAIIDFDLHHGDGSQTITWDHNRKAQTLPKNAAQHKKTPIGYYSLHDINSYPCEWGDEEKVRNASLCIDNAHGQSIWNVHLEPWTTLEQFWQLYEKKYKILLEKTKLFFKHHAAKLRASGTRPKAAIFLSAGFDASQWEGQGMQRHNVNIPTEFYAKFTSDVVELAAQEDLGVDGRVISVLEGGYSDRALMSGVLSHLCGLTHDASPQSLNLSNDDQLSAGLSIQQPAPVTGATIVPSCDSEWWSEANLEAIENRVAGNVILAPKKKDKVPGNYSSPTHASTARMTDVARERRSLSAQIEGRMFLDVVESEPPEPVDWITASHELSRILIPNDRQTLSYRHDELNAESTKARRERQSAIGVAAPTEQRMQLRTRGKGPSVEPENIRTASRTSNRRTTIAAVSELPDPSMPAQRPRRRSSAASSMLSSFQDMKLEGNQADGESAGFTQQIPAKPDPGKKTKMAPPAKKPSSKMSSPKKAKTFSQPAPHAAAASEMQGVKENNGPVSQVVAPLARGRDSSPSGKDDMDDLALSMKRVSIKLKMPTPEQHAENQRKAEELKLKKARAPRKPPVPKMARSKPATTSNVVLADTVTNGNLVGSTGFSITPPKIEEGGVDLNATDPQTRGQVAETGIKANVLGPPSHAIDTGQVVDHVEKTELRSPVGDGNPQHSSDMSAPTGGVLMAARTEPDHNRSIAKRGKAELPVFTSNSPIPFSQTSASAGNEKNQTKDSTSIWEVPETPKR